MLGRGTLMLLGALAVPGASAQGETRLSAGAGEAEITSPVGAPLLGSLVASTGVHDPLWARALVVGGGRERAAIACLDLVGMDIPLADEIGSRVRLRTGIAVILLNCSHTHWAPFTIPWSVQGPRWATQEGQAWRRRLVATVTEVVAGVIEAASHGKPGSSSRSIGNVD